MAACNKKGLFRLSGTIQVSSHDISTSEFTVKANFYDSHGTRRECVPLTASYILPHETTSGRIIQKHQ